MAAISSGFQSVYSWNQLECTEMVFVKIYNILADIHLIFYDTFRAFTWLTFFPLNYKYFREVPT